MPWREAERAKKVRGARAVPGQEHFWGQETLDWTPWLGVGVGCLSAGGWGLGGPWFRKRLLALGASSG